MQLLEICFSDSVREKLRVLTFTFDTSFPLHWDRWRPDCFPTRSVGSALYVTRARPNSCLTICPWILLVSMPYLPLGSFWNHHSCFFLKASDTFSGFHFPTAVCICPVESHTSSGSTEIGIAFHFGGHSLREGWNCPHCTCQSPVFSSLTVTVDSWRIQQNSEFSFWWTSYFILFLFYFSLSVECLITIISF